MNYGEVKAQFAAILNRRDITPTLQDTFLQQALSRIQRELRCPALEKSVVVTIDDEVYDGGLAIPSDFLELIKITANTKYPIELRPLDAVLPRAQTVGVPQIFARQGGRWVFAPSPQEGDVIRIDYYAEFAPVTASGDTNIITQIAPDLIIYGALSYAGDHFVDKRTPGWEARYMQIKDALEAMGDDDALAGGAAVQPAYEYPEDH
jgi:hypothetical protein